MRTWITSELHWCYLCNVSVANFINTTSHPTRFARRLLQDKSDSNFYGFAPNQLVGLKYADIKVVCDEVEKVGGRVVEVKCSISDSSTKVSGSELKASTSSTLLSFATRFSRSSPRAMSPGSP